MLAGRDGHTIETEAEARSFTAAMRAFPASWTPRDMDPAPIRTGETILLEPCVGPDYAGRSGSGRDCPRVELWSENAAAARLVFAALPELTRPLLPVFVDALTAEMDPDEARAVVLRAVDVLHGETVTGWLRAQFNAKEGDAS